MFNIYWRRAQFLIINLHFILPTFYLLCLTYSVLGIIYYLSNVLLLCDMDAITPQLCFISFEMLYALDNANMFGTVLYFLQLLHTSQYTSCFHNAPFESVATIP